jgi:hypothetical protein
LQGGYFRRKVRRECRNPLVFYPRRVREVVATHIKLTAFCLYLHRIRRRVERDRTRYSDATLALIVGEALILRRQEKVLTGAAA